MTTSTPSSRSEGTSRSRSETSSAASDARDVVATAAAEVRDAIDSMASSMPDVARASRGLMDDAMRAIECGSDARVSAGVTLSRGLAIGMLIGGAPRLLPLLAVVPVAGMGLVMIDRRPRTSTGRTSAG
jgi:hypothetical protein